jgi:hypothetical protein
MQRVTLALTPEADNFYQRIILYIFKQNIIRLDILVCRIMKMAPLHRPDHLFDESRRYFFRERKNILDP